MSEKVFAPRLARRTFLAASAASAALMLTGCLNLAPRYEKPAAPTETSQDWAVSPRDAGVKEGELVTWDKFFLDERLRKVIELALANNRDLRQSMLEVERLRALYRVSRAELFPTVGAQASATQSRSSIDAIQPGYPRHSHVYAANLAMSSYEIDFFGKIRNMNEQALQAFFAGEDARRSAQNTLIAEVATEWLSIGADQANLDLARRTLESQTASYGLVEKSYNAGASNRLELNQAKETVATAKIAVQTAIASLEQDQNALRLLVGAEVPADLLPKKIELGATLPATMPAGLPSQVLLRRPDISSAERSLRSANANIGVARAAFFPSITLTSSIGTLSTDMSNLFKGGRGTWSFAPAISLPIFTGGANEANLEAAKIYQKEQVAAYEKAIQTAFREVNDALSTESTITKRVEAQDEMVKAAEAAYDVADLRYKHGVDNFLAVLDSQRTMFSAQQAQISTRLAHAVSIVTLYKVLGGGQEIAPSLNREARSRYEHFFRKIESLPKAAQRCEEILDAAIRRFREKGFHAASMSSIAKAFGMSAGHIYNYFDSKEDIIEAIVNRWLDNYIHTIRIRWNPDPDIHREEVQESIGQQIEDRLTCGDRALMFEIAAESFRNKKIAECIRRADRAGRKHLMEQAVACYREHGVEPPADLEKRLVVVGAFLDGLVFYTGMDPEFEPKTVLPILTDILLYLEKNDGKPSAKGKAEKEA